MNGTVFFLSDRTGITAELVGWGERSEPQQRRSNPAGGLGFAALTPTYKFDPGDVVSHGSRTTGALSQVISNAFLRASAVKIHKQP